MDRHRILNLMVVLALALSLFGLHPPTAVGISPDIVISQVYGGGGNTSAPYRNDYIELFNRGTTTVSLSGWSLQYASATGAGLFGATSTMITELSGSIPPGGYFLVQEASGGAVGALLPTPDLIDATPIAMSATGGKVALANTTTPLGCNGGSTPCSPSQLAQIIDLVGYGNANFYEGSGPTPAPSNTTSVFRANNGCTDTDNNASDFSAGAPAPRNSASPTYTCPASTNPTGVGAATPSVVVAGGTSLLTVAVTPGTNPPSTGLAVTGDLTAIGGSATQQFYDDGTNGDATAGDNTFSFLATVPIGTSTCNKSLPATITDAQSRSGSTTIALKVVVVAVIHDIQGASHISPLVNQCVATAGIVTVKRPSGFYMQDPFPDANDATSEAIYVYTASAPAVSVGDSVVVTATVQEYRPGGAAENLTITELASPSTYVVTSGNPLPAYTVIGAGGRIPPNTVIEDDATGDVEISGVFDPASDGIDFYESMEAMLVQVNNPVAVGPTNAYGEIPVLADDGASAGVRTGRGGVVIQPTDYNPERIILDDTIIAVPLVNVGDHFTSAAVGVLDYTFGNFKLFVTQALTAVAGGLAQEVTTAVPNAKQLAIATFNVENLDPTDPPAKFSTLAGLIVNNLLSPDIIAVEEVQDNDGPTNSAIVDASTTWNTLITAIQTAGGPAYSYRQIDPVDDQDGGEPGGNIRQGFLFRSDRGVAFVDRPGGGSTTANAVVGSGSGTQLLYSPGRIDPTNAAFSTSRKPVAGEFTFRGETIFVIANHFNSKGGDHPLFGRYQPPTLSSEVQRNQQAQVVNDFVDAILAANANANIVVLGDLNDFQFSTPLATLKGGVLNTLMDTLPLSERYSYVYDGNSQALDHILVSNGLFNRPFVYDVVHVNSEFATQASDHEPQVAVLYADSQGPVTSNVTATPNPLRIGSTMTITARVDDSTTGGLNIAAAEYSLNGGATWSAMAAADGAFDEVAEDVRASFAAPAAAGLYDTCVRGTDEANNTGDPECLMLVVYKPGSVVTGTGSINSPAGAYPANPGLTGKATFTFNLKYMSGRTVPTGKTTFRFAKANLNMVSLGHDWLVVDPSGKSAQFQGKATINGAGIYNFMVWITDGPDAFRIKIWYEDAGGQHVVYDNGAPQPLSSGRIVIKY